MVKKSKFMKIVDWILNILIIVFFIGSVYMILWRIFSNSPTDFQVVSWIVGLLSMVVFRLFGFTYNINREVGELKIGVRNGFRRIKEDIGGIKTDVNGIKGDMNGIKMDLNEIKRLVKKR